MPDFAYLNARLRAMRARLLPPDTMAMLAAVPDLHGFLLALAPTGYGRALSDCRGDAYECLTRVLRDDALATLSHLHRMCSGQERAFADAVFAAFDTANVAAVLRGVAAGAPVERTLAATLPLGRLPAETLAVAAAAPDLGTAATALARARSGAAMAVVSLLRRRPDAEPWEIEGTLDAWCRRVATEWVEASGERGALREASRLDADVANLTLTLRLTAEPRAREALVTHLGPAGLVSLFATRGRVTTPELARAVAESSPEAAIVVLRGGPYGSTLAGESSAVGTERALRTHRRQRLAALATADPLGPGLLLGYLAAKQWEWAQLRHIGFRLARHGSAAVAPGRAA